MAERPVALPPELESAMASSSNKLLSALSTADFGLLEPHLEPVALPVRKDLEKPNKPINVVYFADAGFASVVAIQSDGRMVEVGLAGREGMTGVRSLARR